MKSLLFLLIIILFSNGIIAQTTAIPDANFEQELIKLGLDNTVDAQVLTSNIDTLSNLNVQNKNISTLSGIEDFIALTFLNCNDNLLTSINVTQNINLIEFWCYGNQLPIIDVSQNASLVRFHCDNNLLTNIDVSQNAALYELRCYNNQLTSLDLTQNQNLGILACSKNQLTSLNLSQNPNLTDLWCWENSLNCLNLKNGNNLNVANMMAWINPNLTCIEVDDSIYSTNNWDSTFTYSTNCGIACNVVGINDYKQFATPTVYPNPTSGQLSINLEKANAKSLIIRNSLGQLILVDKHPSPDKLELDISNFYTGIYFIQIKTTEGDIKTIKVLKE